MDPPKRSNPVRRLEESVRSRLPDRVNDVVSSDLGLGLLLGAGMGFWAISKKTVEGTESSDLIGIAGASVGVLAVTLAVLAIAIGFWNSPIQQLILDAGGVKAFSRPFWITSVVSAVAILVSIAGAIDASSVSTTKAGHVITSPGPTWLAATLYGIAVWFFVWAVVGAVQLVRIFVGYGETREEAGP
jgi:hypothetical protein